MEKKCFGFIMEEKTGELSTSLSDQQQIIAHRSKTEFIYHLKKWVLADEELKLVNENTKRLRETKIEHSAPITIYMMHENHRKVDFTIPGRNESTSLRLCERNVYSTLTFSYIESCLNDIIVDKTHVKYIMDTLKERRTVKTHTELV
jgi:hypothetical protein